MDSSLSIVPPVMPKPLPDILATFTPRDATIGITIRVTLSPTPPLECLSTIISDISLKSSISPDFAIAKHKCFVSSSFIPFRQIAIVRAEAW